MKYKKHSVEELIDPKMAEKLKLIDEGGFLEEIVGIFKEQTPGYIDAIQHLLEQGKLQEVRKYLHKIKGGCGTLGALLLMEELEEMGNRIKAGKPVSKDDGQKIADLAKQTIAAMEEVYLKK